MKKICVCILVMLAISSDYLLFNTQAAEASSETICDLSTWSAPEPLGLENWIDHAADGFAGGTGRWGDPFLISTPQQLAYLAKRVNEGHFSFRRIATERVMNDISLRGLRNEPDVVLRMMERFNEGYLEEPGEHLHVYILNNIDLAGKEWTPVGTEQHPFIGFFNGDNHIISNLIIATPQDRQGLFGVVEFSTLENITLVDVNIRGRDFVGGLVGAISRSSVKRISLAGAVEGRNFVGGVSGFGYRYTVNRSAYLGSVRGDVHVGGLVGMITRHDRDRVFAPLLIHPLSTALGPYPWVRFYIVTATVSARKHAGGIIGNNAENISITQGIFAGGIDEDVFTWHLNSTPVSIDFGLFGTLGFPFLATEKVARGVHSNTEPIANIVLRYKNDTWYLNSSPLLTENAENNLLRLFRLPDEFASYLTESVADMYFPPSYMLHVPYGTEIPQDEPLSIDITRKGFFPVLSSFTNGNFWIEDNYFKMSGTMNNLPSGIYAIPCFKNVNESFESVLVLLNLN